MSLQSFLPHDTVTEGYFVCYGSVRLGDSLSWRLPFVIQAVVGIVFSAGAMFLPHSPRWLKHIGREGDAAIVWGRLGFTAAETEKEQETAQRIEERTHSGDPRWWDNVLQLFDKSVRKRTLLGCFLMASQQVCSFLK